MSMHTAGRGLWLYARRTPNGGDVCAYHHDYDHNHHHYDYSVPMRHVRLLVHWRGLGPARKRMFWWV